jgi:hypothetical protein
VTGRALAVLLFAAASVGATATLAPASTCAAFPCSAATSAPSASGGLIPVGPGSAESRFASDHYDIDADTGSSWNPSNWPEKVTAFLTNVCFGLTVFLIKTSLAFVTWAFTFGLAGVLAAPAAEAARRLTESAYARFVIAAVVAAGLYAAWHGMVRRRVTTTMGELALSVVLLGGSGVVLASPAVAIDGGFGLARSLTGVVVDGVSPCSSSCGAGASSVSAVAVAPLTDNVWELFVRKPWFYIEFGKEFPQSSPEYDVALDVLHSEDSRQRLGAVKMVLSQLDPSAADYAVHASVSRLVLAMAILGVTILVALLFFLLAGTVVAAQFAAVALVVLAPLAFLAGVVPGMGQRLFQRWGGALLSTFALVVAYGLVLAVVLVVSGAILGTSAKIGLLAAQGLEAVLVFVLLRYRRALGSAVLGGTIAGRGFRRAERVTDAATTETLRAKRRVATSADAVRRFVARPFHREEKGATGGG